MACRFMQLSDTSSSSWFADTGRAASVGYGLQQVVALALARGGHDRRRLLSASRQIGPRAQSRRPSIQPSVVRSTGSVGWPMLAARTALATRSSAPGPLVTTRIDG